MTAPAGALETSNFAEAGLKSMEIEEFAPEANTMFRLAAPYPLLLAETAC
jgi:hypothetical protein